MNMRIHIVLVVFCCLFFKHAVANLQCHELFELFEASQYDHFIRDLRSFLAARIAQKNASRYLAWGSNAYYARNFQKQLVRTLLTDNEIHKVRETITGFDAQTINSKLLAGNPMSTNQLETLSILRKLPAYMKTVYRGVVEPQNYALSPISKKLLNDLMSEAGTVIEIPNFWSTSKSLPVTTSFMGDGRNPNNPSILLVIHPKSARDIEGISQRDEREVIILPGTILKIIRTEEISGDDFSLFSKKPYQRHFKIVELVEI